MNKEQHFFLKNRAWHITANSISDNNMSSVQLDLEPCLLGYLFEGTPEIGAHLTPLGETCDFLKFLKNVSSSNHELMSKLCAIGYLLSDYKDRSNSKAVVAIDENAHEIGMCGISIFGQFIRRFRQSVYLGRNTNLENQFVWSNITEHTRIVLLDDVPVNFDFGLLFNNISGDWIVNRKAKNKFVIPFAKSPKILITSRLPLLESGLSYTERMWKIWFTDYYKNIDPIDEFGRAFFREWNLEQWCLAWNLAAQCVQIYSKYGFVQSVK
jgi:hypothetical protein